MGIGPDGKNRCFGDRPGQDLYARYHDLEWGRPVRDDRKLFEMLVLEGAQAGLSWETILRKREGYREAFHGFDVGKVAAMSDADLERLRGDEGIVRNRLKIRSARTNARVFRAVQDEFGGFAAYAWGFVGGTPITGRWKRLADIPAQTAESVAFSKDLRRRGMCFVGPTIVYAYMQAVGMVDDHIEDCWLRTGGGNG